MERKQITVPTEVEHQRLDVFLARELSDALSRTRIKHLIEEGCVQLNGKTVKAHTQISPEDKIEVAFEPEQPKSDLAEPIAIDIIYEDEDLMVVNKQAGLVVHPGSGNPSGTLVNALLHYTQSLSSVGESSRRGIVHRLDKDTSGLMVIAKNDRAHRSLAGQFKRHTVEKCYWAVVKGVMQHDEMRSNEPLGRSLTNRKRVIVRHDDGKESTTNFRVLARFKNTTLVEARPLTGRMHQIRVHLRVLGHPVLGDAMYGVGSSLIKRQALHAMELGFVHPTTQKKVIYRSELPKDIKSLLDQLKK